MLNQLFERLLYYCTAHIKTRIFSLTPVSAAYVTQIINAGVKKTGASAPVHC